MTYSKIIIKNQNTDYQILVCNNFHFDILTRNLRSLFSCMIRVIFTPQYGHTKINGDVLFFVIWTLYVEMSVNKMYRKPDSIVLQATIMVFYIKIAYLKNNII